MSPIIPRDLIRHLEWKPGVEPPAQKKQKKKTEPENEEKTRFKGDLSKYIQVGIKGIYGEPVVISPFELKGYNNKNYNSTHHMLLRNGFYMPTPRIFMKHFTNVVRAYNRKKVLLHADESEVPKALVEEMYKHMTEDFKDVYSAGNPGVWTWLNAKFEKKGDEWHMETVMGKAKGKGKKGFLTETTKLEDFLKEDCFIDFSFNDQGLPKPDTKSKNEGYKQGKNVFFYSPIEGSVAGFDADSVWAGFFCDGDPSSRDASLGVYGCAEGTHEKIRRTKK